MFDPPGPVFGFSILQYAKRRLSRSSVCMNLGFMRILLLMLAHASLALSAFATCLAPKNPIEAENCLAGNPPSQWYIQGPGSSNIRGFTADISGEAPNIR